MVDDATFRNLGDRTRGNPNAMGVVIAYQLAARQREQAGCTTADALKYATKFLVPRLAPGTFKAWDAKLKQAGAIRLINGARPTAQDKGVTTVPVAAIVTGRGFQAAITKAMIKANRVTLRERLLVRFWRRRKDPSTLLLAHAFSLTAGGALLLAAVPFVVSGQLVVALVAALLAGSGSVCGVAFAISQARQRRLLEDLRATSDDDITIV